MSYRLNTRINSFWLLHRLKRSRKTLRDESSRGAWSHSKSDDLFERNYVKHKQFEVLQTIPREPHKQRAKSLMSTEIRLLNETFARPRIMTSRLDFASARLSVPFDFVLRSKPESESREGIRQHLWMARSTDAFEECAWDGKKLKLFASLCVSNKRGKRFKFFVFRHGLECWWRRERLRLARHL